MRSSLLFICFLMSAALIAQPASTPDWESDEAILRGLNLPTKGDALLEIFRSRTPKADTVEQFNKYAAKLGAATFPERMKATKELLHMGPVVRPLLERLIAEGKHDIETKRRLEHVLGHFPPDNDINATISAARLLLRDKPADRLAVLLDFVPHSANEMVRQEVQLAINGAAMEDKKPAPLIVATLKDESAAKRAAAGEALVRTLGPAGAREQIAPLMKDMRPQVRYQLGMALVEKHDKTGLPLLIRTITEESPERVEYALDVLYRAAGDAAPSETYRGKASAEKVAAAWQKWHDKNLASIDLSKMDARTDHGYTVIVTSLNTVKSKPKIYEIGPKPQNPVRWEFACSPAPYDVQVVGPNRLLLAEYSTGRVTERDFKGNILKTFNVRLPIACQRMPNGNTFIVTRTALQIVDPDGKEVFSWQPQANMPILSAQRSRNGQIAVAFTTGLCQLLDSQGKELKQFKAGPLIGLLGANIELLPNGHVLLPIYSQQLVAEFDWSGKRVWQANVPRPLSVSRLANGNTLVTTSITPYRIIEIDRSGQEVWSYNVEGRAVRARRW